MSRDVVPAGMVSFNVSLFNACVTLCVLGDLLTIWHPPPFQRTDRGIDSIFICLQSREWPAAITQHSSDVPGPTQPMPAGAEGWSLGDMVWWPLIPHGLDLNELWEHTCISIELVGTCNPDFSSFQL